MTTTAIRAPIDLILPRLEGVKPTRQGEWQAFCPIHESPPQGHNRSLTITEKPGGTVLLFCHSCGKDGTPDILKAIDRISADLFPTPSEGQLQGDRRIVATYDYCGEDGKMLYQTVRYSPKTFKQRQSHGKDWQWNLKDVRRVLYHLPEITAADPAELVFVVEGERDADALAGLSLVATTCPMGAGKWRDEYSETLRDRHVIVIGDNDTAGGKHAEQVARALHDMAAQVKVLDLPDLPDGGDVSDWLAAGGTSEQLVQLVDQAVPYEPKVEVEKSVVGRFPLNEFGNADRLVALHGRDLRWCDPKQSWFVWNGKQWREDDQLEIEQRAKLTIESIIKEATATQDDDQRAKLLTWAAKSCKSQAVTAMLRLARSDVAVPADAFDRDPWLLNTLTGTVDLRTGRPRPHNQDDMLSKMAPVEFDPDARLDLWDRFLTEATGKDVELQAFLQRAVGYSLTGSTAEEVMFFVHGPSCTGKSTFIEAIKRTLGDYAWTADFRSFLRQSVSDRPRSDIAQLAGRRFVASIEVDEGKKLAEGLVKLLTGGDTVSARFLYQREFNFRPEMKLWLASNHAPRVDADDEAMWRRIHRVPFEIVVPEDTRDPQVKAILSDPAQAGPAILAWAVRGCVAWQREGLNPPSSVVKSTDAYRQDQDVFQAFIDEACDIDPDYRVARCHLRVAYEQWCEGNGERPLDARGFAERLRHRGFGDGKVGMVDGRSLRAWTGLATKSAPERE